jgi:multidrug efflux pump subunit AcrA (membrane-fusion protein)
VRVGQPAVVKVTAYDFARDGSIEGRVTDISATTFLDEATGTPFYKMKVALAAAFLGGDPVARPLLPGMTVQVDVRTGDRTVLDYLLKPVDRAMEGALHEP